MDNSITLKSGNMEIQVLKPYSPVYTRTRFNHAGIVSSILYKGVQFAEPEQRDPSRSTTGGIGLSGQINCLTPEEEAREGEQFLRLGIGVMTRQKELIHFSKDAPYDKLNIRVDAGTDSATFVTTSPKVNGYAYEEKRVITVSDNSITMSVQLKNTGDKTFEGNEYNHNFLSLGGLTVGPDYHLELPLCKGFDKMTETCGLTQDGQGVTWEKTPERPFYWQFDEVSDQKTDYAWKLCHQNSPRTVREIIDFVPEHITVWGTADCACTEVFVPFKLLPGEGIKWSRKWVFEA